MIGFVAGQVLHGWIPALESGGIARATIAAAYFILKWWLPLVGQKKNPVIKVNLIYPEPRPGEISRPGDPRSLAPVEWTPELWEEGAPMREYDILIISDIHLRDPHMRAKLLLDLLKHHRFKQLIILGDFLDYEVKTGMPSDQKEIFRLIFRLKQNGVDVIFVPGNHDERWRMRIGKGMKVGQTVIPIQLYARTLLPNGKNLHLEHGDGRDGMIREGKSLQHIGSWALHHLQRLDVWVSWERVRRSIDSDFSYAIFGKRFVKSFLHHYRQRGVSAAQRALRGVRTVIAMLAHIHIMEMRYIDGSLYICTGDDQNPQYANAIGIRNSSFQALVWRTLVSKHPPSLLAAAA
jgi:UDP-2,3-diacylglucosamine pyrophosphatase LpxH